MTSCWRSAASGAGSAAPVPQLNLIGFHGVRAPNAKLQALVEPQELPAQAQATIQAAAVAECEVEAAEARSNRISWARLPT